jgi:hypothetical protein
LYDVESFEFKIILSFTKNRSSKFDYYFLYKVPNRAGFHQAKLLGEFKTGGSFENNAITGATISPDASKVLLYVIVRFGFSKLHFR